MAGNQKVRLIQEIKMYSYYKSLPGYLSAIANISIIFGIILLFFNWHISIMLFLLVFILWSVSSLLHRKAQIMASQLEIGLKKSAEILAKKYRSKEGIEELN